MTNKLRAIISRRAALKVGAAGAVVLGSPFILRQARGETPIKIGIPTVITGTYAEYGSHVIRTSKLIEKETNNKGGLLGRPIKFLIEDTQGDPKGKIYTKNSRSTAPADVMLAILINRLAHDLLLGFKVV